MSPLLLLGIAAAAYILIPKLAGAGSLATSAMSIDQLAAYAQGKSVASTGPDVRARFVTYWNQVRSAGGEGWVMTGIHPAELSTLPADWHYLVGRLPGPADATWWTESDLVWHRFAVKKKEQSKLGQLIGSITGGIAGTLVAGPGGTAAGAKAGGSLGGLFS